MNMTRKSLSKLHIAVVASSLHLPLGCSLLLRYCCCRLVVASGSVVLDLG